MKSVDAKDERNMFFECNTIVIAMGCAAYQQLFMLPLSIELLGIRDTEFQNME